MKNIPNLLNDISGPHQGAEVLVFGDSAKKALILLHGRGGSAEDIATFRSQLTSAAYTLMPEAAAHTWYPERFLLPQADNQPALDSALAVVAALCAHLETLGIKKDDTVIAGFSQGACLTAEYVKRYPAKYAGVCIMSGGFIGDDAQAASLPAASLHGTPVYIGCDRQDAHIPLERVELTAEGFTKAGGIVGLEVFSNYGHRPHLSAVQFLERQLAS